MNSCWTNNLFFKSQSTIKGDNEMKKNWKFGE